MVCTFLCLEIQNLFFLVLNQEIANFYLWAFVLFDQFNIVCMVVIVVIELANFIINGVTKLYQTRFFLMRKISAFAYHSCGSLLIISSDDGNLYLKFLQVLWHLKHNIKC